jgi:putative membrane protein
VDPRALSRPDPVLRTYYILVALCAGPGVVVALPLLLFKYATLRYRFDDEGISMSWGVLFRREVYLTYRRIQDIHVTRGIVQRWLGIATISVQTAAGSSNAEMQIEGIVQYEALRDFLYRRMRGAHTEAAPGAEPPVAHAAADDEALRLLREIHEEIRRLRGVLATHGGRP